MLRTIGLTIQNEVRLLLRDPMVLMMLLFAPVVIITVAGYSLGALYGGGRPVFTVPLVDHDGGEVATGLIDALERSPSVQLVRVDDLAVARERVLGADRAPLAIEIPAGTSAAIASGRIAPLVLHVDPARRVEVNALEIELDRLFRRASAVARARANRRLVHAVADLRRRIEHARSSVTRERDRLRAEIARGQTQAVDQFRRQIGVAMARAARDVATAVRAQADRMVAARAPALDEVRAYLGELSAARGAFETWFTDLRTKAGSHASEIPPPPAFPSPPSDAVLAALTAPLDLRVEMPTVTVPVVALPSLPDAPSGDDDLIVPEMPVLPGQLDVVERSATEGGSVVVNAFDQYVPGFGVTFLLIGMMLGIALTIFDEREWGTLARLTAGGTPIGGLLVGKVLARVGVGVAQMIVLFAVGWALFDISLGRQQAALLNPTVRLSFAAAAFGLLIASVAHAHDAVMPLGTMLSLAMSAIGGCWWPLDFEPGWMKALAAWLPTTWTMQAFNDLMIRQSAWTDALVPAAATTGIGVVVLVVGVVAFLRRER
jgi:ABC-type multidrug transport system permease subunit